MKYRLTLLKPEIVSDKFGAEETVYVETRTVHAERVRNSGSMRDGAGEHFPAYHVEYNIRGNHEVSEHWQVRQLGGDLYWVTNILYNLDRGMQTLICERVNE